MKFKFAILIFLMPFTVLFSQDSSQTFLSVSNTGVESFVNSHPEYDGRGTIIFILDTGVDMGIDGLQKTSTGEVKVIDAQDFTGEGDIKLYDCKTDEVDGKSYFVNEDEKLKVGGAGSLALKSLDGKYLIGALDETQLQNSSSGAQDLNGNGSKNDKYYVVVFRTADGADTCWVAYFDLNDNGDLSDEKPIRNYKEKFDSFSIPNSKGLPKLTFALNIFPEQKKISLHFDDGAHGTHVSGIASGYHIGGTYLNGVAPGAKIISLKIGNNKFSGGATVTGSMKNAFIYADKVSKERKEPCVLNMSFGIGSEIEGLSEMEQFLDTLLNKNPYLYVCFSNGNDGPGISTAGLPASSNFVLSSGAVLAREVGRDLFGSTLNRDVIFFFSSRGGEVSKPDICSPGACTSTVPNWEGRDVMGGTSMASPYTSGVVSLILSAMQKEYPGVKIPSLLLFKAIRNSAVPMDGYTLLDQGSGYINVPNAYSLLKKYISQGEIKNFESYTITSFAPNMPDGKAPDLYIRNGNYLTGDESYSFFVKRNNFQDTDKFYRIFNIKSNADWLKPVQKKTYIRNDQRARIDVKFDKSKLSEPGLYTAKITATRDDKTAMPEFEATATVIIPYVFDSSVNYSREWNNETVEPAFIKRYFISVPSNQSAMAVTLSKVQNEYSGERFRLFDPDGVQLFTSQSLNSQSDLPKTEKMFFNLRPGVYELDVEGLTSADKISNYNLSVKFNCISRLDKEAPGLSGNTINVINTGSGIGNYNLSGKILGYSRQFEANLKGSGNFELPFIITKDEASKTFKVALTKNDFNKVTDFSLLIYNEAGEAIEKEGLSYKDGEVSVNNTFGEDTVKLRLELAPAFVNEADSMTVKAEEVTLMRNPLTISVKDGSRSSTVLYPFIQKSLECKYSKPGLKIPDGNKFFGKIYFESGATGKTDTELPIYLNF